MQLQNERAFDVRERRFRRWLLPAGVILIGLGVPAFWFGPAQLSKWKQHRLVASAITALQQKDLGTAVINLRRALALNPDNIQATRELARIAKAESPRDALVLWERLGTLDPSSSQDAQAWAETALDLGETAQAEEALERMRLLKVTTLAYHQLAARLATSAGREDDARQHFHEALKLDPHSERDALGLAVLDVASGDESARTTARETLRRLRDSAACRHDATRALISEAVERGQVNEALPLAEEFVSNPSASFEDRLQYLAVLRVRENRLAEFNASLERSKPLSFSLLDADSPITFDSYLNNLREQARRSALDAAKLITTLNSLGQAILAVDFAASLSEELRTLPPVAPAHADSLCALRAWTRLGAFIADRDWHSSEFLRAAFQARVQREMGDRAVAATHWAAAVKFTEYRPEKLSILARLAANWGWRDEWEDLAWTAARTSKRPRQSLLALEQYYRSRRDATKLFKVCSELLPLDPADVTQQKTWARLSFILKGDPYRTGAVAEELYRQHPEDPEIVATFALIQHQRELYADALAAMNRLTLEQRRSPLIAGIYAVVLAANRQKAEAAEYFARAKDAPIFREEQAIIDHARRTLD